MAEAGSAWRPRGAVLLAVVALVWAGMVIGVSGLATPVKFQAPSLSLPVALDVGRVTFHLFTRVEWGLVLVLALLALVAGLRLSWLAVALVAILVLLQAVWLLPALDARVAAVIAGSPLPASAHHILYVGAETVKLGALLTVATGALLRR